ncbi:LysR family transcriptional regulator [Aureimonas ureilytica]|uniref:LysR family transcriptional regulator n=1 Tax=Aureimonas ureilytica TaxID=401562 RepID=UPI003CEADE0E
MNWDDVRVFLAVARAGQILAASRRLGLNHATVGRRLDALEAALGAKLFDRRPNGCETTREGASFLAAAERMEAEMLGARASLGQPETQLSGTVRIGAPDGFGTAFLAPRLGALAERHPALTVQLVPVPRAFSISRREADIAITVERPSQGRLVARRLVSYALGLYGAGAYLDQFGRPGSVAELRAHRLVGHVDDLVYSPSLHYAGEILPDWQSRVEISSALGQLEAVAAGAGIGILHAFMAGGRPGLERVLPDCEIRREYWLVTHETSRELTRIRAVADFIAELVQGERALFG